MKTIAPNLELRKVKEINYWLPTLICFLFGVTLILNVTSPGDSVWFWLTKEYLSGKALYSDIGYVQQPLYIELNAIFQSTFGESWLGIRAIAIFNAAFFSGSIWFVLKQLRLKGEIIWILYLFTFFVGIQFEAFRFDDYHVVTWSLALITMGLGIQFLEKDLGSSAWKYALALGLISGIGIMLRVTEGGVIFLSSIGLVCYGFRLKFKDLIFNAFLLSLICTATCFLIIALSGDSLHSWYSKSIVGAAAIKGGGSLFSYPLFLLLNISQHIASSAVGYIKSLFFSLLLGGLYFYATKNIDLRVTKPICIAAILFISLKLMRIDLLLFMVGAGVFIAYWLGMKLIYQFFVFQALLSPDRINKKLFVICIPLGLIIANSMSSAGFHFGMFFPFVTLVISLVYMYQNKIMGSRISYSVIAVILLLMAVEAGNNRYHNPYSWHSYVSAQLFKNRIIYDHPQRGLMYIDKDLLSFIIPICQKIGPNANGLLSIPFPFANYFCDYKPWNGYVQTFFDTSSPSTINKMMEQLDHSPPTYVLYQQQLENLERHEKAFNSGNPLPHRLLDSFIVNKIENRAWTVELQEKYGQGNLWLLIDTSH